MTRADYLRREDRRRLGSSVALSLAAYVVVGLLVGVAGLIHVADLGDLPNPVWVDIGSASDLAAGQPKAGDVPAPKGPVPPVQQPAPAANAGQSVAAPPTSKAPGAGVSPTAGSAASGAAKAAASAPVAPSQTQTQTPSSAATAGEAWTPGPRPEGSHVISTSSGAGTTGAGSASSGSPFTTKVVGDEKGNSLETVLGVGASKSGRSLYVPIYLYMPLPRKVEDTVAVRVAPQRRDLFLRTYKRINEVWVLSRDVPVAQRDEVWLALEEGGYDVAHADYKEGADLKPVTLSFVVTPGTSTSPPSLAAVSITSGSGDPAVDEAVLYGFKRASFFNATDGTISGSFTYSFSK